MMLPAEDPSGKHGKKTNKSPARLVASLTADQSSPSRSHGSLLRSATPQQGDGERSAVIPPTIVGPLVPDIGSRREKMADLPTLHVDVPRTRRKNIHMVTGRSEHVQFTAPKIGDCLLWLLDKGETIVNVETGDVGARRLVIHLEAV